MAIAGKKAQVKVSGDPLSFSGESFSTTDDQNYQIDDAAKRVWCRNCTITVYEDGAETTEDYSLNRLTGVITFASADGTRGTITADGQYLPMSVAAEAYDYTYTIDSDNAEDNAFGDEFISRVQTLKDISGSISRWYKLDSYYYDALTSGEPVVIELYADEGSTFELRIWGLLATDEITAAVDGLVEEAVDFEGTHDDDNRALSQPFS